MIAVIGLGFIGLTTALGFSHYGHKVFGVDSDHSRLRLLKKNRIPFHEPHLKEALEAQQNKNFFICDSISECLDRCEIIFFCVGTPCLENGLVDLNPLKTAIGETISKTHPGEEKLLVIRSTIPPTTTIESLYPYVKKKSAHLKGNIKIAVNPEFLREGLAWSDFTQPDRIIVGELDSESGSRVEEVYRPFKAPVFRVSCNTAEFIKYLSNTLLATLISFSNEQKMLAEKIGNIDISRSFDILHKDRRWSGSPAGMASYVFPGCGFGGYCLPKDAEALCKLAQSKGFSLPILEKTLEVNKEIKQFIIDQVAAKTRNNEVVGILGLAFKPNTDDVRETPAKDIIQGLLDLGFTKLLVYDPMANENFRATYGFQVKYAQSVTELSEQASKILILTAWPEFQEYKNEMKSKIVFDSRYLFSRPVN